MSIRIHPSADVASSASIGEGTSIWHQCQVREGAILGENCILGRGVFIDTQVQLGNNVKVQNYVSIYHGVRIEDGVFVFLAIEPPDRHAARIGIGRIDLENRALDPVQKPLAILGLRRSRRRDRSPPAADRHPRPEPRRRAA